MPRRIDLMADHLQERRGTQTSMGMASVLREHPTLARHLTPGEVPTAGPRAMASVVSLPKGVFWPHERLPNERGALGMLLLAGLLLRGQAVRDRPTVEVLAPGDLFRPFERDRDPDPMVFGEERWWALRPARVAVLDAGFTRRMCAYPDVITELATRLACRSAASSLRLAIVQEPRLSVRLHCMLWQLADRFGEAQPEGVVLRLPLCHMLLAWLVGARRPAISRAINELERARGLAHRPDGTWWLGRQPPEGFGQPAFLAQSVAA